MSSKIVHTLLLFYCLTLKTYTNCQQDVSRREPTIAPSVAPQNSLTGIFAKVQRIKDGTVAEGEVCGAVWIDDAYLITAASCFDEPFLELDALMSSSYKVNVIPMLRHVEGKKDKDGNPVIFYSKVASKSQFRPGKAILHPLFKRNNFGNFQKANHKLLKTYQEKLHLLPIAYDVALVKVDNKKDHNKEIGDLCREENVNKDANGNELSTWTALAAEHIDGYRMGHKVKEWQHLEQFSEPTPEKMFTFYYNEEVFINPYKQFTTIFKEKVPEFFHPSRPYGEPILTSKDASVRCIAGIISYTDTKGKDHYIVATKVYTEEIQKWIEHAKVIMTKMGNGKKNKEKTTPLYDAKKGRFSITNLKKDAQKENQLQWFNDTRIHLAFTPGCPDFKSSTLLMQCLSSRVSPN